MKSPYLRIFLEILPILIGIVITYFFWQDNILLTVLYLLAILLILMLRHEKGDLPALFVGLIVGLLVEIIGTSISGYQSFTNPDFLGIPIWLPVAWAYGFLMMKRVGVILYFS